MKNFPHQVNDLGKLTAALGVANVLIGAGKAIGDDGLFGAALAQAHVYTFRNKYSSIDENLKQERQKPVGSQGFRTAARDIRRFFALTDLLDANHAITQRGNSLLDAAANISLRNALWREALLQMCLADDKGRISHPYRIMLRLVADHPGIETSKLALALEAVDDSATEFARIEGLAQLSFNQIVSAIGGGDAGIRNATKILPGVAEQVGDIYRSSSQSFPLNSSVATEDSLIEERSAEYERTKAGEPISVGPSEIAPMPSFTGTPPTNVDLTAAIEMRKKRTIEHQKAVTELATIMTDSGYALYRYPYDCLGYKQALGSLLIEMKTLDGTRSDERRQSEKALGQLHGYNYYNITAKFRKPKLSEIIAFTAQPSEDTRAFMRSHSVYSVWREGTSWLSSDLRATVESFSPDRLLTD